VDSGECEECLQPDSFDFRIGVAVAGGLEVVNEAQRVWQLQPGEMAIIITEESVDLPADMAAEVSPRLSILNEGVLVLTAPHVDPGYSGPLTARVINLLDNPYPLRFERPMLTVRFYLLDRATDRPSSSVSPREKLDKAIRESRDTFHRLFHSERDLVLKSELHREAFLQGLQWLALLLPAIAVVFPFSVPIFWKLGTQAASQDPWVVVLIVCATLLFLAPLFVLYTKVIQKLWRWL